VSLGNVCTVCKYVCVCQAIITMIPEAWQNDAGMSASKKAYYRWNAYSMEPWDGPGTVSMWVVCLCVNSAYSMEPWDGPGTVSMWVVCLSLLSLECLLHGAVGWTRYCIYVGGLSVC